MPLISPELWKPIGVDSLEPAAEQVVRSKTNTLVVAGPGAGKTELLAQRACYLLETGLCSAPQRILAISFKRDAAKNLEDRVQKRCTDQACRFDSLTLDAFAKGLIDRFRLALSNEWKPSLGYEVMTRSLNVNAKRDWLASVRMPDGLSPLNLQQLSDGDINRIFDYFSHGIPLPYDGSEVKPLMAYYGLQWWKEQLKRGQGQPSLSFPMLNRLAAFLLRRNPKLTVALRATYAFVFLDEFQDTTSAQYDLVRAAFQGSSTILTAVGDSKQRIMVWAGAMPEAFKAYETNFNAIRHNLMRNYRSAPELVQMQHIIAQTVEAGSLPATAAKAGTTGSCILLEFSTPEDEATYLADLIEQRIHAEGKKPRDICILVRQKTSEMIESLKSELATRSIRLRDESQLQDILAEPIVRFLLAVLSLGAKSRDAEAWDILSNEIAILFGFDEGEDSTAIERECRRLIQHTREAISAGRDISILPAELIAMVDEKAFKSVYRQYRNGSYLKEIIDGLSLALSESASIAATPREIIDDLIGVNVIPAMTIHKSKGLEFHTVIFLGLEDSQWWAFANQADEEKRGFFVAFSRASEYVYFTYSDVRDGKWGRKQQRKVQIGDLYSLLQQAGVPTKNCRPKKE